MGANSATWSVDTAPFAGHRGSVEDIQWSPSEATVFISSSTDRAFKVWDTRSKAPMITVEAHSDDINVISWSRAQTYLLATGCDDGSFKVWDLRAAREGKALANFTYHKGPITSVDWAPHDESVLCVSSADNQVTVWDLSVEADEEPAAGAGAADLSAYPPQLLFIHQGQQNVKEIHHHPHIPGVIVSTAEDGFNVFKPAITVSN
jgi:ribosome assembly protein RRB1